MAIKRAKTRRTECTPPVSQRGGSHLIHGHHVKHDAPGGGDDASRKSLLAHREKRLSPASSSHVGDVMGCGDGVGYGAVG